MTLEILRSATLNLKIAGNLTDNKDTIDPIQNF